MTLVCLTILIGGAFALAVYFSETYFTPPYLRHPKAGFERSPSAD